MPVDDKKEPGLEPGVESNNEKKETNILEQIEEVKKNSVPKEKYEKLQKELNDVYTKVLNGDDLKLPKAPVDKKKRMEELKTRLYGKGIENSNMTNLEYISDTLELRELIIEQGGDDPFLGVRKKGVGVTESDYEKAENIATTLQEMVDEANGSPDAFRTIYSQRVVDVAVPQNKNKAYRRN